MFPKRGKDDVPTSKAWPKGRRGLRKRDSNIDYTTGNDLSGKRRQSDGKDKANK